jgi:cell division septal protein FtsQ
MRHTTILAAIAGVVICAFAHAGDVYKYVDERGNTLYTDKPIPGAVLVSTGSQKPPEAAAKSYAAQQASMNNQLASSNQRIADGQTDSRLAANVAKDLASSRADRCKQAREGYNKSIQSLRMYREKDGKREYLSDAELAQARVDAARSVETVCGPQG